MFEHEYIYGGGAMVILHGGVQERYGIIRPKVVVQGRKAVNFRGVLQCICNA